jgi:TonB family protein
MWTMLASLRLPPPLADSARRWLGVSFALARRNQRSLALVSVALLHVLLFYMVLWSSHLTQAPASGHEMQLDLPSGGPRVAKGAPPRVDLAAPSEVSVPLPDIVVDTAPETPSIALPYASGGPAVTVPAEAIGETHTSPPLSDSLLAVARRALLRLHLMVGTDGSITKATVDNSSGSPQIDALTVAWVRSHWRFRPAMRDGQPVEVVTTAVVPF